MAMCVSEISIFSKSWILQVAQPRVQPSDSCVPVDSPDRCILLGCASRYVTSSTAAHVGVGVMPNHFPPLAATLHGRHRHWIRGLSSFLL